MKEKPSKEGGYGGTIVYSLIVVASWGIVPCLAKLGSLPTGLTTFYVNWFAVGGLLSFLVVSGKIVVLKRPQPYKKLILFGLIWPLIYSIAYFAAIDIGGASLTTITNYFWPVIFLFLGLFFGKRFSPKSWIVIFVAIFAVAIPIILEGKVNMVLVPLLLGLTAAFCQALYSLLTEQIREDPFIVTLVVELVTACGATLYVACMEKFVLPDLQVLSYLAVIGVISNGLGFWAFLRAGQVSQTERTKTLFLILMCLTPIIQVVLLPILKIETVSIGKWIGVTLIAIALLLYRLPLTMK